MFMDVLDLLQKEIFQSVYIKINSHALTKVTYNSYTWISNSNDLYKCDT